LISLLALSKFCDFLGDAPLMVHRAFQTDENREKNNADQQQKTNRKQLMETQLAAEALPASTAEPLADLNHLPGSVVQHLPLDNQLGPEASSVPDNSNVGLGSTGTASPPAAPLHE
jgi:hypothetical protein